MKKAIACVAGLVMVASAPAWGQAKNFEGLSMNLNANALSSTTDLTLVGQKFSGSADDTTASMQIQYNRAISDKFLLGVGLESGLSDAKSGQLNIEGTVLNMTNKKMFGIFGFLGFAVGENVLIYAKPSLEFGTSTTVFPDEGVLRGRDLSGLGLGVGLQLNFNKNLYGQFGFDQVNYDAYTNYAGSLKSSFSRTSLGIGYRF
jgi:hypothetical protein